MRGSARATAVGMVIVAAALTAACTGQQHRASSGSAGGGAGGDVNASGGSGSVASEPLPAVGAPDGNSGKGGSAVDAAAVKVPGPSVIRTADLTVVTPAVAARADQARVIVTGVGGSVDSDNRTSGTDASASMTLRVPPDQLGPVLSRLSALGQERSRHSSTNDVTTQVADVDSRVRSALAAIAQLRELYGKATRVADIIAIEGELAQREADLESLQAQQRALDGQIALATVTLYLQSPAPMRHAAAHRGFTGGLIAGWQAFSRTAVAVVTAVGAVLPFLVVVAVVGGLVLWTQKRRAGRRGSPAADPVS